MKGYLVSAVVLFVLSAFFLSLGVAYGVTHPSCNYCIAINPLTVDDPLYGQLYLFSNYFESVASVGMIFGIIALIIGIVMIVLHKIALKEAMPNTS